MKKIKKIKPELSKDNPFIDFPVPGGVQEIKGDNRRVEDYSLPEQGKLTKKEQLLIQKYKGKGVDFTDLVLTLNELEKEYKKKYLNNKNKKK